MNDWKTEDGEYGRRLTLCMDWSESLLPVFKREDIQELVVLNSHGFRSDSLDFLTELSWLKSFTLLDFRIKDISGVHALSELRSIYMGDYSNKPIDFTRFPLLKECRMEFSKNRLSVTACKHLDLLSLQHYPYSDLSPLTPLMNLSILDIAQGSLRDITEIGRFKGLKDLSLVLMRNLNDISAIASLREVEKLTFEGSKGFHSLCALSELTSLRSLNISRCGSIDSLSPLLGCKKLEFLDFSYDTVIADGDIKILLDMPKLNRLWMANRRHYNLKREEIPGFYRKSPSS